MVLAAVVVPGDVDLYGSVINFQGFGPPHEGIMGSSSPKFTARWQHRCSQLAKSAVQTRLNLNATMTAGTCRVQCDILVQCPTPPADSVIFAHVSTIQNPFLTLLPVSWYISILTAA